MQPAFTVRLILALLGKAAQRTPFDKAVISVACGLERLKAGHATSLTNRFYEHMGFQD